MSLYDMLYYGVLQNESRGKYLYHVTFSLTNTSIINVMKSCHVQYRVKCL